MQGSSPLRLPRAFPLLLWKQWLAECRSLRENRYTQSPNEWDRVFALRASHSWCEIALTKLPISGRLAILVRRSFAAEKGILCSMLIDSNVRLECLRVCTPEIFFIPAHRLVFVTLQEIESAGTAQTADIDFHKLKEALNCRGALERIRCHRGRAGSNFEQLVRFCSHKRQLAGRTNVCIIGAETSGGKTALALHVARQYLDAKSTGCLVQSRNERIGTS